MNRTSAAAVAVAAVLGITGGTYAAGLGLGEEKPSDSGKPTSTPSESNEPTPTTSAPAPSSPAQLLYMDDAQIHDGYTRVSIEGIAHDNVRSLVRIAGGWLLVSGRIDENGGEEPSLEGTVVAADGKRTELEAFGGGWDINEDGTQLVAHHVGGYRVTDLKTFKARELDLTGPEGSTSTWNAAFAGAAVLTGWQDGDGNQSVRRTDLKTGTTTVLMTDQLHTWTASPRGLLMVGEVMDGDHTCMRGGRVEGDHADWWRECDWILVGLRPRYAPNGEKLLVIPEETDGFGPGTFGVLDTETGREITEIDAPDWTTDAEWGDNDEVFLIGQKSADDTTTVIRRCKLDGECVVEKESPRPLLLGAGT